jgi:hypothetical protein
VRPIIIYRFLFFPLQSFVLTLSTEASRLPSNPPRQRIKCRWFTSSPPLPVSLPSLVSSASPLPFAHHFLDGPAIPAFFTLLSLSLSFGFPIFQPLRGATAAKPGQAPDRPHSQIRIASFLYNLPRYSLRTPVPRHRCRRYNPCSICGRWRQRWPPPPYQPLGLLFTAKGEIDRGTASGSRLPPSLDLRNCCLTARRRRRWEVHAGPGGVELASRAAPARAAIGSRPAFVDADAPPTATVCNCWPLQFVFHNF